MSTAEQAPSSPQRVEGKRWWAAVKRAVSRFREEQLTDDAAALTYYGILSIFPAIIALFSIFGLIGAGGIQGLVDNLQQLSPSPARDLLVSAIQRAAEASAAGIGLALGLLAALWTASGYVGAFGRASNEIYGVEEERSFWKLRPQQIGITAVMLVLLALSGIAVVLTGDLASQFGDAIGVGDTAVTVWNIAKWPVLVLIVAAMLAILYWSTPNVEQPGLRWLAPGALLAVLVWITASAAFSFYLANFGSYNATYGSLAGAVIFLIWLWISNIAVLLGALVNAELERGREMAAGVPREETIALDQRESGAEDEDGAEDHSAEQPRDRRPDESEDEREETS